MLKFFIYSRFRSSFAKQENDCSEIVSPRSPSTSCHFDADRSVIGMSMFTDVPETVSQQLSG
jgi:hypothetical protein